MNKLFIGAVLVGVISAGASHSLTNEHMLCSCTREPPKTCQAKCMSGPASTDHQDVFTQCKNYCSETCGGAGWTYVDPKPGPC